MTDTIAAIATPMARSAIGILRLSGPHSLSAVSAVFRPSNGKSLEDCGERRLIYGTLSDRDGKAIDSCLATFSRAPHTYTGEDTAELQCHGSPAVLALGLEALFAHGARQARPGEFTQRAFLNGKLDLTQAEAVADLIDAETPAAARVAALQLSGALGRRVEDIYTGLTDLMAHFCAVLDYPDEDIDPFRQQTIRDALEAAEGQLSALLATYNRGRHMTRGVPCAIVGRPNAGKSSLLNALVGYDRAIVTDIPGTTRDTIEEKCELGGVLLRLMDTAGLRDTSDEAERLGVERSRAAMERAELILVLLDQSRPADQEDVALVRQAVALAPTILLLSKMDLPCQLEWTEALDVAPHTPICAPTGQGLDDLADLVADFFPSGAPEDAGELLTNARQAEAARRALESLQRAGEGLRAGITPDAVLTDVECALASLGELTGRTVREDVTSRIFERFCVGK